MTPATLEMLPDGVLQLDGAGRVVFANRIAVELLGGDPVGRNVRNLRAGRGRESHGLVLGVWRRLDGGIVELESSESAHGDVRFLTLRDMSQRAVSLTALRDERNQLQAVLQALPTLVILFGPNRRVQRMNTAVTRATGIEARELLGAPDKLLAVVAAEDRDWLTSSIARAQDGESVVGDLRLIGPQGPRAYEVQLEALAGKGALMICRNITRERELMGVFRAQARKDVAELALLAGSMAHDLNDAMTVVASALDSLPPLHGDTAVAIAQAERALSASRRTTQDLLHLGRRDADQHSPVNLGNLLERVVERLAEAAPSGVEVRLDNSLGHARVVADPSGIIRMLHQLGVNALRAVGMSGSVEFRAHEVDAQAVLDIEDDGVGIPRAVQAQIFKPFTKSEAANRQGLALVRGLVQSYGGEIQLQSSAQTGTLFRVSLPIHERATTAPAPSAPVEADDLPRMVLLVEDNAAVRNSLAALLTSHDVVVHKAQDGVEALRMVERLEGLELVLLDIGMPGLSGDEVLSRMKHRHPDLPVLMMSGYAREEKVQACLDAGALGYVSKPFRLAELRAALRGDDDR